MEKLQCLSEEGELSPAARRLSLKVHFIATFFQIPPGRVAALTWMFSRNYRIRAGHGHGKFNGAFSADGKLLCCFWLFAEDVPGLSLWDMLRGGLLEMPFRFGLTSMRRLLAVAKWTDAALDRLKQEHSKHLLLERMVVLPDYQGSGVGTAALSLALKEADTCGRAVPWASLVEDVV
ncbi:pac [Symbiodinium sp. CCMP2592]|nr:pac [Symbiodinium sp. CCMP2592]CAE7365265.1 pac [Symbiodinium sp. CCMP2592]